VWRRVHRYHAKVTWMSWIGSSLVKVCLDTPEVMAW
jgi:hypothetical protein